MPSELTSDDEGKAVVSGDETLGRVVDVEHGTAYVDPDPGITDTVKAKLGWDDADVDDFTLEGSRVETVTDDEIRLKRVE